MSRLASITVAAVAFTGLAAGSASAATTRVVGPGHPYAKPCQAIAAAAPGDTVQIDAAGNGSYDGDVCRSAVANLTIEGVGGRARVDAAGRSSGGKAIWVLAGPNTVVRNVELSGAAVAEKNGAAIRLEGDGDLTLSGVYFHDNQNGILVGGSAQTDVVVEGSAFANNGAGDGYSHNIYISGARSFTMRHSSSRGAKAGHLVKSRATVNDLFYNRLTGEGSTSSYEVDIPNGGRTRVVGNVIQQGPNTGNSGMLSYGAEGARNPDSRLSVVNNTFVDDRPRGGTAIAVGSSVTSPAQVVNNIAVGQATFVNQTSAQLASNCLVADPRFVNRAAFDHRLQEASPCRDAGTASIGAELPTEQYVYDHGVQPRPVVGPAPDAGAFEWGAPAAPPAALPGAPGAPATTPPAGGGDTARGGSGAAATEATPGSAVRVLSRRVRRNGTVALTLRVADRGALSATASLRTTGSKRTTVTYGRGSASAKRAGRVTLVLRPTSKGRAALRRHGRVTVALAIRFRPTGSDTVLKRSSKVVVTRRKGGVRAG
jgi:hypothetical protein